MHGRKLKWALADRGLSRSQVAEATGVRERTVTNWTSGATMPNEQQRAALKRLLGPYDDPGDPVELAVRGTGLLGWRQDAVLSVYKRHVYEQSEPA